MAKKPDESADEQLVKRLIADPNGLTLARFSEAEMKKGKTPDFRVLKNGKLVAYLELKSPRDDRLDEALDTAPPGQIVRVGRADPTFNRLGRHVKKSASQFQGVDPQHTVPHITLFVNHDDMSDDEDLRRVLTGQVHTTDGTSYALRQHTADWVSGDLPEIDIMGWVDAENSAIKAWFVNELPQAASNVQTAKRLLQKCPGMQATDD